MRVNGTVTLHCNSMLLLLNKMQYEILRDTFLSLHLAPLLLGLLHFRFPLMVTNLLGGLHWLPVGALSRALVRAAVGVVFLPSEAAL